MSITITGQPMLEEVVETCLRRSLRSALDAAGMTGTRISCYWLGDEVGDDDAKGITPPYVFVQASPATMPGYRSNLRNMSVVILMATLQDDDFNQADSGRPDALASVPSLRNLYKAIRYAIDTEAFTWDAPIVSYGFTLDDAQIIAEDPRIPMISLGISFRFAISTPV